MVPAAHAACPVTISTGLMSPSSLTEVSGASSESRHNARLLRSSQVDLLSAACRKAGCALVLQRCTEGLPQESKSILDTVSTGSGSDLVSDQHAICSNDS